MNYNYHSSTMDDVVFNFIYGCALVDAITQKSFDGDKAWIGKEVPEARETVKTYITQVLSGTFEQECDASRAKHEAAFLEAAITLCKQINDKGKALGQKGTFHFGNAQKLINMTVKHVYAHTYSMQAVTGKSMREKFRYCHCPMDQKMLEIVWKAYKNTDRRETLGHGNKYNGKHEAGFCKPWGNEDFALDEHEKPALPMRYLRFQKGITDHIAAQNGDIFPIEYDYLEWKPDFRKQ